MSSVAARSFGLSASVMRPISPYLNTASTCPFHHFTDGLLLGRGNASCRCQELIAKLVKARTST